MASIPSVQFITNQSGEKTAAVIPIEDWNNYAKFLDQYYTIKDSIKTGLKEAKSMKATGSSTQSVEDFLDEL